MKKARSGRWHLVASIHFLLSRSGVEMKKARSGRWHTILYNVLIFFSSLGRNEESPFRALTHLSPPPLLGDANCRNEESPFRALTQTNITANTTVIVVEMKKARSGRWHLQSHKSLLLQQSLRRNEESPFRALTHPFPLRFWHYAGSCRNEKSPICTRRLNEKKYRPTLYICYRKVTKSLFQDMYCILSR